MKETAGFKICSKCKSNKPISAYYTSQGRHRSECKVCTSTRNNEYQKQHQTWKTRYGDDETRKKTMRQYYQQNQEKFREYRKRHKAKSMGQWIPPKLRRNENEI